MNPIINYAKSNEWKKVKFTIIYKNVEKGNLESDVVYPEEILLFNVSSHSALLTHEDHNKVFFDSFSENEGVFIDPSKTSVESEFREYVIIVMENKTEEN